jgi:2-desacetyl-2-hydroxyethyl bacteriochlorophyllide A dehydrogenase
MARMNDQQARAFWIATPGRGEIRAEALPPPADDDIVVRARFSGISRGTEALIFEGRVPPREYERMRAPFQAGAFPAPIKYGYASVGIVERGPRDLQGRHVFVLYPHQTRYHVPAAAAFAIPDGVPPERAVLAANMETAINGLWDARPHVGDRVIVIGGGTVGCLVAWLATRIAGCEVQLVDVNPRRASVAKTFGVAFASPHDVRGDADVVIHASASSDGLALALRVAGLEATVVDLSWYGDRSVPVALGEDFHSRRLTLASSQVGRVPASQRARWDTRRRMELALRLLADPSLDTLITGESPFEALPQVMAELASAPGDTLCHRIRYS